MASIDRFKIFQGRGGGHGSVATDAAQCSRVGTGVLQASVGGGVSGNAADAAVAAALCLVVLAPHRTGLDALV